MNTQLIPVVASVIGHQTVQTVDGRTLHTFLEVQSDFRNWIKNRIEEYGFEDDKDFRSFFSETPEEGFGKNLPKPQGGRPSKEYALTLGMAKELAMVERNEKGRQARRYFIECERKLLQIAGPRSEPAALVPILSYMEIARSAALAPDTRQHIQRVFQGIQELTARERKAQRVDCRVILQAVVDDILSWRYGCPYAYGFNLMGKAYLQTCSSHIAYHLRSAPHFKAFFEKMNWLDERKITTEWELAGLTIKTRKSLLMDGSRLDLVINLPKLSALDPSHEPLPPVRNA